MMSTSKFTLLLAALFVAATGAALAAGGPEIRMEPAPINRLDLASQQRGARTFVNYCLNCHSAKYMRYNRLTDLGLTEAQIRDNLMFATDKIGETMTVAMRPADAKAWFGVTPPDLTVEARVRGADWLYNYFLGFYRDETTPSGWNNVVFPNVAMPHVLAELSGTYRLVATEYKDHDEAKAAALAAKGIVRARARARTIRTSCGRSSWRRRARSARSSTSEWSPTSSIFSITWASPRRTGALSLGLIVLLYLGVLFVFAYWMKREYWKDVH